MIARLNCEIGQSKTVVDPNRTPSYYCSYKLDGDLFPDPVLIELHSKHDPANMSAKIEEMLQRTKENYFPIKHWEELLDLVRGHFEELCINLSDEPAKID